jgi:hypothetical protein
MITWEDICAVQGQTWAAWVQAIGSVLAIYATAKAVRYAHDLEIKRAETVSIGDRLDNVKGALQLVGAAAQIAKKIFDIETAAPPSVLHDQLRMEAEINVLLRALQKFDGARMESYEVTEAMLVTETCLTAIHITLRYVISPRYSRMADPYALRNSAHGEGSAIEERAKLLARKIDELENR